MANQNVVFRVFPEGDVIAILCNTAKDCNPGFVMSYQHVGQHGECDRRIGQRLKLATPEQYGPLLKELQRIYKDVTIVPVKRLKA